MNTPAGAPNNASPEGANAPRRGRRPPAPGWSVAVLMAFALLAGSCATPDTRDEWLNFFFDGVPVPGAETAATNAVVAVEEPSQRPTAPAVRVYVHEPYASEDCSSCHASGASQRLVAAMPQLCLDCHSGLALDAKVVHDPAQQGECLACHAPHESLHAGLLLKPALELCADCHDLGVADAKVVHAPVADGECLSCHDPHASDHRGLLKQPVNTLCFECHAQEDLLATSGHEDLQKQTCTQCHDPHVSDHKALLKKP